MYISTEDGNIRIKNADFSARKTFECGQCFRFERQNSEDDGETYCGTAFGRVLKLTQKPDSLVLHNTSLHEFESIWRRYLDLDRDYKTLSRSFLINDFMKEATFFSRGLRILAQDSWEAWASFILSQCSNIPRIKQNVENLCRLAGEKIDFENKTYYSFPHYNRIAELPEEKLAPLRLGYRAPYLLETARFLCKHPDFFDNLRPVCTDEAEKQLTVVRGTGKKVAHCVLLFGLGKLDAFPVDTWMKKAEKRWFSGSFNPAAFGKYAGIAQQYIFYYTRNGVQP